MRNERVMGIVVAVLGIFIGLVVISIPVINSVNFDWNCEEYIKRAADAASPEKCGEELDKAIQYAKEHGITTGNTGIIFKTPACDVGFWYDNLVGAREALKEVENTAEVQPTSLERSNVLMRVREALLDNAKDGVSVTLPPSIGFYPHVLLFTLMVWGGILIVLGVCVVFLYAIND